MYKIRGVLSKYAEFIIVDTRFLPVLLKRILHSALHGEEIDLNLAKI